MFFTVPTVSASGAFGRFGALGGLGLGSFRLRSASWA